MKKWICLLAFVCTLGVAVLAAGIHSKAQAKPDDTILEGVYAGEISLSGMTRDRRRRLFSLMWIRWEAIRLF